jgi:uncharacterized damage-inducible protein DinB
MPNGFKMFAGYNAWANRRLYDACAALRGEDLHAGLGAFFGSLHGTLNHLLVTDRIWLARLHGETPPDLTLDTILHDGFAALRAAREAEDVRLVAFVEALDDAALAAEITYRPITRPETIRQPLWSVLAHLFNHQTHHRGQCHAMLTRVAIEAPSLDLILYQRETGDGLHA